MTPAVGVAIIGSFVLGFSLGIMLCRYLLWRAHKLADQADRQLSKAEDMLLRAANFYTNAAREHIAMQQEKKS